jgi:hypothetical protein
MKGREQAILTATDFAVQAVDLLSEADQFQAVPYLKQAVAILKAKEDSGSDPDNKVAMGLLRMALVLLDRNGEGEAAGDVESALERLGEPFPVLSDLEARECQDFRVWAGG